MRSWQALLLTGLALFFGLVTENHTVLIAALALGVIVLVGVAYRVFATGDVLGERAVSEDVVVWGDTFAQEITLKNQSWIGIPAIRVVDLSTLPDHPGGYVTSLGGGKTITWNVAVPCHQRGRYQIGPVEANLSDPLGLFPVTRRLGGMTSMLVLPRWVPLTRTGLQLDGFMPGEARGRRRGESPPTVTSIRDYTSGDPMSTIHWQASARTGHLMTKLFDPEVQTTLWFALDLDGEMPAETEELLVTATTSLAMYALQQANLRVGLVTSGEPAALIKAERGRPHQYRLQETLAEVHAGGTTPLAKHLAQLERRFGPGQALVLVTAREPETWGTWLAMLTRQGVSTRVIHVTTDRAAMTASWPVPYIMLPQELNDLTQETMLIHYLEGRARGAAGVA